VWQGVPTGLFRRLPAPPPSLSLSRRSRPLSLDIRGEKGQELDAVHAASHPHVPEVRAVMGPEGRGVGWVREPQRFSPSPETADPPPAPLPSLAVQASSLALAPQSPRPGSTLTLDSSRSLGLWPRFYPLSPDFLVLHQPSPAALSQASGEHAESEEHASSRKERVGHAARLHPARVGSREPRGALAQP
jgi:hypothetical protein